MRARPSGTDAPSLRTAHTPAQHWRRFTTILLVLGFSVLCRQALGAVEAGRGLDALVRLLAATSDPQIQLDVLRGISDGLADRRTVAMPAGWEAVAARLAQSTNLETRELAQSLSLTFGSPTALTALRATLTDSQAPEPARRKALAALLQARDPGLAPALRALLAESALRASALRALAAYDDHATPPAILSTYGALAAAERREALRTLASRPSFARALLAALAQGQVSRKDLTADLIVQLRNLKDPSINRELAKVWGVSQESSADKLTEIDRYRKMLAEHAPGSPARGREVFLRVCAQCHTLFGTGGNVGPDLTGYNRSDLDYLLQNIIDPNSIIPNDYRAFTLETKDDRVLTGIVTRQDARAVTIISPGETNVVPRAEIVSLQQGQLSIMPEALLQGLSDPEVADLIAYLKSPESPPADPGTK